jgi:WD40 repeat protein
MNACFTEHVSLPGESISTLFNLASGWILCGSLSGLVRFLSIDELGRHVANLSLKHHSTRIITMTGASDLFVVGDSNALISFWRVNDGAPLTPLKTIHCDSTITSVVLNSSVSSYTIAYADGLIRQHPAFQERAIWETKMQSFISSMLLSPDGFLLAVGLNGLQGAGVTILDMNGSSVIDLPLKCSDSRGDSQLQSMSWSRSGLAVFLGSGKGQIYPSVMDEEFILIDCQESIVSIAWNPDGFLLAIAAERSIILYSQRGLHLKTVSLMTSVVGSISCISWHPKGRRLFAGVDKSICVATIHNPIKACFTGTHVLFIWDEGQYYIIPSCGGSVKTNLLEVRSSYGCSNMFAGMINCGDSIDCVLISIAGHISRRKRIIETTQMMGLDFDNELVIAASESILQIWNLLDETLCFLRISDLSFHQGLCSPEDHGAVTDAIVDVALGVDQIVLIARESGVIHILRNGEIQHSFIVNTRPEKIRLNCDSSFLAVLDYRNKLHIVEMSTFSRFTTSRDECWHFSWAIDDPLTLACMDKDRLYVLHGREGRPEEPLNIGENLLVGFASLEIVTVNSTMKCIEKFPSKRLRDFSQVLSAVQNLDDAFEYVLRKPHRRLWSVLADHSLLTEPARFDISKKCYELSGNDSGFRAVEAIEIISDPVEQRVETFLWLKRFDEAEQLALARGRNDLWLRLKKRVGDFQSIAKSDDWAQVATAVEIGDFFFREGKFPAALDWYKRQSGDVPYLSSNHFHALLFVEDYEDLIRIGNRLPSADQMVVEIARVLGFCGIYRESALLYCKAGRNDDAFKICQRWGKWDIISELENKLNVKYERTDPVALIKSGKIVEALDVIKYGDS